MEDEEIYPYQNLIKAIILRGIKDMILPFGKDNSKRACREGFNFLFNEKSGEYDSFIYWCELANFSPQYWKRFALMTLAYELNFKPWLRSRLSEFLKGKENWALLKKYYCNCYEKEYHDIIEAIENGNYNR